MKRLGNHFLLLVAAAGLISPIVVSGQDTASAGKWAALPVPRSVHAYHAAVALNGKLYVVGGDRGMEFEVFDPQTGQWQTLKTPPTQRMFPGAAAGENSIYLVGGLTREKPYHNTVEAYDIMTSRWRTCAPMQVPRSRLAAVAVKGRIYAVGGIRDGRDDTNVAQSGAVEEYDPNKDRWVMKAEMPTPRHGHAAVVLRDKVLILGGYSWKNPKVDDGTNESTAAVEEYDPAVNRWVARSKLPTARGFLGAAVIEGRIYAVGGRVTGSPPFEVFDPQRDAWSALPTPPVGQRFGCAELGGRIYVIGGEESERAAWCYTPDKR
jgi:N-acetylneuraminic acid mutarotase